MAKKILCVGFELASDNVTSCEVRDHTSPLDWDIIVINPEIPLYYGQQYQGKPSLDESDSFKTIENLQHWRSATHDAVASGRSVFVFLSDLQEFFVDTGRREYSGTGRNRKTTRLVEQCSNYEMIPYIKGVSRLHGNTIRISDKYRDTFSGYWLEFESLSNYQVVLEVPSASVAFQTKNGEKCVGAVMRGNESKGLLACLPDLDFAREDFFEEIDGEEVWSEEAQKFAARFVARIVELDRALRSDSDNTPPPKWASDPHLMLPAETRITRSLLETEETISKAQREKEQLEEQLAAETQIKGLLFEKGAPLENAIIEALKIIGFEAENYSEGGSEFDAVFADGAVRLLGEAEGKDSAAINITKLRQLAMNIQEDLERDEVSVPAKGVLFGNAFRLLPLQDREQAFTEKCISAANANSYALVETPQLFLAVLHYLKHQDPEYAEYIRAAISSTVGLVRFEIPHDTESKMIDGP